MDETMRQEALLRNLLSEKTFQADKKFIYSFLLGSRLFLSPHQLLTDLHRLSNETIEQKMQRPTAEKACLKCRQVHTKTQDISTSEEAPTLKGLRVTSSATYRPSRHGSEKSWFRSSAYITVNASPQVATEGDETIRRKKRGRRRNQEVEERSQIRSPILDNLVIADRSSKVSRDSGILSAVLDWDELDNVASSAQKPADEETMSMNDSGLLLDEDSSDYCHRCHVASKEGEALCQKRQLVHVLHEWVKHFPADFRNKKIMWTLNDVIKNCQSENEELKGMCTEVVDCISRRLAAQESYEQQLSDADIDDAAKKSRQSRKTREWMVSLVLKLKDTTDVNEMAQQLCLIEMDFLKHVGAEEFLQIFTADGDEDVKTNLGACVRWFNRLSHLVGTVICTCRKRKHTRHVITLFARVANKCFELSNFNSAMAILTGLSLGPVTRLKKTWNKLIVSELQKLQSVFDPSSNFLRYRTIYSSRVGQLHSNSSPAKDCAINRYSIISQRSLSSQTSSSTQHADSGVEFDHERSPERVTSPVMSMSTRRKHFTFDEKMTLPDDGVMVPFLVLLVKDVYFLNHAIPTVDEKGNVNVEKLRKLANILSPLEEWRLMTSSYHKNEEMQNFLLHSPVEDDADLYLLSYKREAPINRFEKQQLKSLKVEQEAVKRSEVQIRRRKTM